MKESKIHTREVELPKEVRDAQERVRPLYEQIKARNDQSNPLRELIDECMARARPDAE